MSVPIGESPAPRDDDPYATAPGSAQPGSYGTSGYPPPVGYPTSPPPAAGSGEYGAPPAGAPTVYGAPLPAGGPTGPGAGAQGFVGALFDFSFTSFVTTKIVKSLYVLAMLATAVYTLILLAIGFRFGALVGIFFLLVVCPLFFLFVVAMYRMLLEFAVVVFRISENIDAMARRVDRF